jgi:hypothetical protein
MIKICHIAYLVFAAALAILNAGKALAEDATTAPVPDFSFDALKFTAPAPDAHRWSVELLGTALDDVNGRHVVMGGLTGGVGYFIFDNLAIDLDVTGYGYNEGRSSGAAAGVTLGLRHQLFTVYQSKVFADISGGEIEASNNLPVGGTHLNDTLEVGLSVMHPIATNVDLMVGVCYFHLSNARSEGADRNPSINAVQGVVGLVWRL